MTAPLGYDRSCVPVALSVLFRCPPSRIASLLAAAGCHHRRPDGGWGTDIVDAIRETTRLGARWEFWWPRGERGFSVEDLRKVVAGMPRSAPRSTSRPAASVRPSARISEALTPDQWSRRFPGAWLLGARGHALACVDMQLYGHWTAAHAPLANAFRLIR